MLAFQGSKLTDISFFLSRREMDSRIRSDQQGLGWGSASDKVAGGGLSKQVTLELSFRDEAGSVLGWGGEILGKQAEWAQRPCSRNASGELEGQGGPLWWRQTVGRWMGCQIRPCRLRH